jgi:glycine/D-amino acid oxidase-like deaminating enzyme
VALGERLGVAPFVRLAPEEVAQRTGSPVHLEGVLDRSAATIQPAFLALGLRRAALQAGVRIYEQSPMTELDRGRPAAVRTPGGRLRADKVVLAMNAWAARLPELRRALVVLSSEIVATAPIPERLAEIGWTGGEAITDSQQMVDYYRTTRDGRIAFGKGGGTIAPAGRMGPEFDRNEPLMAAVRADFHRVYPSLIDVPLTHEWSGPIDKSMSGIPILGRLSGREHLLYGVGWTGNGVGPSVLGGWVLASLALGLRNEWSESPLVDQDFGRFPPEPAGYLAARAVREAVRRKEAAEARGRRPSRLAVRLARLAPAGLEDHGTGGGYNPAREES